MPAKKEETGIVDEIVEYIKGEGGDAYKTLGSAAQRGGEPDVTGEIYSNRLGYWLHLKLEVKTDEGEPTGRQEHRVELYEKRGYIAGIVRSVSDVQILITDAEDKALREREEEKLSELVGYVPLEMANGLNQQLEAERTEYGNVAGENAQLRLWLDRFCRATTPAEVGGLRKEAQKTFDWL